MTLPPPAAKQKESLDESAGYVTLLADEKKRNLRAPNIQNKHCIIIIQFNQSRRSVLHQLANGCKM